MFLRNLLGRQADETADLQKYDNIDINDNIPEISEEVKTIDDDEQELTPNHPLYFEIFKKQEKKNNTQEYVTKEDDTLAGIALKLNISEDLLKNLNGFSSDMLFPNMVLVS
jgi:hypothetical protein